MLLTDSGPMSINLTLKRQLNNSDKILEFRRSILCEENRYLFKNFDLIFLDREIIHPYKCLDDEAFQNVCIKGVSKWIYWI